MTFIDWSDFEEMFGLLIEYATDERGARGVDAERQTFLANLVRDLERVQPSSAVLVLDELREIAASQPGDFAGDEVMVHVHACIEELERITSAAPT